MEICLFLIFMGADNIDALKFYCELERIQHIEQDDIETDQILGTLVPTPDVMNIINKILIENKEIKESECCS